MTNENDYDDDLSTLEKEFKNTFDAHSQEIADKLKAADALVDEALALSEKHGLPFRSNVVTAFSMSYIPESLDSLFPDLESDFWNDLTDAYGYDGPGWQTSQIC